MKKLKKTPTKQPQPKSIRPVPRLKKTGGNGEEAQLAVLKKYVGFFATGETAAKVMILGHHISYSKLFARQLNEQFDRNRTIQKRLKDDFKGCLLAYYKWVISPDNKPPVHPNLKVVDSRCPDLKKYVGFATVGETAAKTVILGHYFAYSVLLHDYIHRRFGEDAAIQAALRKPHKNDLYAFLVSLYPQK